MEEHTGWRGALSTAWGNLIGINNGKNVNLVRLGFFALFALGTAWVIHHYFQSKEILNIEEFSAVHGANFAQEDQKRLDAMIQEVESTSRLRASSPESVSIVEALEKYPFGKPELQTEPIVISEDTVVTVIEPPVVIIDYPPTGITLRAIMIMGKRHVAVMDIPGVGTGMVVKPGDTFMQKKGRIVRITPDKVVINWGGKNWDIAPSF